VASRSEGTNPHAVEQRCAHRTTPPGGVHCIACHYDAATKEHTYFVRLRCRSIFPNRLGLGRLSQRATGPIARPVAAYIRT
jgi:hypothetical protein